MERLMVLILAMSALNIQSCKAFLSLSWSAVNDKVILRCKTDSLNFPVSFLSPTGEEIAICNIPIPDPQCDTIMPNISVKQDIRTLTTTLTYTRNIASSLNGQWKCKYGTNIETGTVNITVMQIKDPLTKKKKDPQTKKKEDPLTKKKKVSCLAFFPLTMIGFLGVLVLMWHVRYCTGMLLSKSCKKRLSGMKSTDMGAFNFAVLMALLGSVCSLLGLPILVDTHCKDCCEVVAKSLFILFGSVIAVPIYFLTEMYYYVQMYDRKQMQNNNPNTRHSTKGSEMETIDLSL